ncbi:B12-binding domain-containing radical SAM protein [Candidatus Parcubacteria bacterium]|nr:B12-binding domain-containing radical SAM protein [Candidatus Parcubacteria bacterium]
MKALLVYPEYPDTFWSFKHALPFISKKAAFPPLGLLTVAAILPKNWDIELVDVNVEKLTDQHIKRADMIFISAMLVQKNSAQEIILRCKQYDKTVVAGGPAFSAEYRKFNGVDHFILGESEIILPLFLNDFKNGVVKQTYISEDKPDIKITPIPRWPLINFDNYATMAIQFSRGCPFNCDFCDITRMYGRTPRTKAPKQIVAEVQSLYSAGWRGPIFIVDDNFIGNKRKTKEMLLQLIDWQQKRKYPFQLFTEASVNLAADEDLMRLMSKANFNKVFVGIESPNEASLKGCGKIQNTKIDLENTVKIIHQHGIQVMGGFIVGFDEDDSSIFESLIDFIQNTGIVTAMVGILNALPQTQLWQRLQAEDRLLSDTTGENTDGYLNFIPKMDKNTLVEEYKKMVAKLYSPRIYYRRINTFLENYKPTAKGKISKNDIKALFRSMWLIGISSRSSPHYWKLILKILFTKPRLLHTAVEMAIFGRHFKKVAENISS